VPIHLGLDCGGSSIRALAIDESRTRVFTGQAGAGNLATTPPETLEANLRKATASCVEPATVCGCFAGLLTEGQERQASELLKRLFPKAAIRALPDFAAILRADPEADVCVISGTGSLICSYVKDQPAPHSPITNHQLPIAKSGGRGYLLGDVASGQAFGKAVLNHLLDDPKGASQAVLNVVEETFHSLDDREILAGLYQSSAPAALLARLAKAVGEDCEAGIPYAVRSVEENFRMLAEILKTHLATYCGQKKSVRIALAGGLWKSSRIFQQSFTLHISRITSEVEFNVELLRRAPVEGAADLALEMAFGN